MLTLSVNGACYRIGKTSLRMRLPGITGDWPTFGDLCRPFLSETDLWKREVTDQSFRPKPVFPQIGQGARIVILAARAAGSSPPASHVH
jgi:hypothetical protein